MACYFIDSSTLTLMISGQYIKKKMVNVPYIWDRDELEGRVELKFCK